MNHSFDIAIAQKYGMLEAVLVNYFVFWITKNKANQENYFDGCYWTYNSIKALGELFPYATEKQIRKALKHLIDEGILKTGNYNKLAYDRTLWYALTEEANRFFFSETSICPNGKIDLPKWENGNAQEGEPIPFINTFINTDIDAVVVVPAEEAESEPIPQPPQEQYEEIIEAWNSCECTQDIKDIKPLTRREDRLRILLNEYGIGEILHTIEELDQQEYFRQQTLNRHFVSFDWFVDINNYQKVIEGNYRYEHREETFEERLARS